MNGFVKNTISLLDNNLLKRNYSFVWVCVCLFSALCLNANPVFIDAPVPIEHRESEHAILVPEPQEYQAMIGCFSYPDSITIKATDADAEYVANVLAEELTEYFGLKATVGSKGAVSLAIDNKVCGGRAEAYTLEITPKSIKIVGRDRRGLTWGVMTLLQLSRKSLEDMRIHVDCATISDWPKLEYRGYFFELNCNDAWGGQSSFEWLKRCIRRFCVYYKCNMVGLGESGAGCFPLKKHEFTQWKRGLTAEQIKELVAEAKHYGIDPFPVVEVFGHAEGLILKHEPGDTGDIHVLDVNGEKILEIAELDQVGKRGNSLCLSNPKTREVVADVFDSVYELFDHPKFFHIGMDEAVPVGTCPECRKRNTAELYAEYLTWCHDYLKNKGAENIMMWADTLLDHQQFPNAPANSNVQKEIDFFGTPKTFSYITHPALNRIPKDMIMIHWDYSGKTMEPVDYLQSNGFQVWGATFQGTDDAYRVGRTLAEKNCKGWLGTTWTFSWWRGAASLAGAEAAWSPSKAIRDFDRETRLHLDMLPPRPSEFNRTISRPMALNGNAKRAAVFAGAGVDQRNDRTGGFPEGKLTIGKVDYQIDDSVLGVAAPESAAKLGLPKTATLLIKDKAVGIAFLQAGFCYSILMDNQIGTMTAVYNDGSRVDARIRNGMNMGVIQFHDPIDPVAKPAFGWATDARLYELRSPWNWNLKLQSWEWMNPCPEKVIDHLEWKMEKNCKNEAYAIFAASLIVRK
jgi:hypothetical protein